MGARLLLRHRRARSRRNAVRGAGMKDERRVATPSQTVGPFFHLGLTPQPSVGNAGPHAGDRIRLRVAVTDGDGQPVDDALVELWYGDRFGRMPTDKGGTCEFDIMRP